jgi:hypothetical protein
MQDRSYAIAVVVVLAICCLGVYVAISGYLVSRPPAISALTPGAQATPVVVTIPTATPEPTKPVAAPVVVPTVAPLPSPLGAFQTITAATTAVATLAALSPTAPRPPSSPTSASLAPSCSGFAFCPRGGPPDFALGPGGMDCPRNYIWGRVVDANGQGMPNVRIRFKSPSGGNGSVVSKAPPDPPGIYNIPTGQPGSTWVLWLDAGGQASPQFPITTQIYSGTGNCPTRVDFAQQR